MIVLTQNTDLQRVQIVLSALTVDTVRIERSTNNLFWQTVRGGVAVPVVSGAASLDDYEWQSDVENFYRVLDVADDSVEEADSITPSLNGEVWFKSVRHTFLNMVLPRVLRRDPSLGRRSRSQEFPVSGRSVGVAVSDVRLGQQFTLSVLAESLDDPLTFARNLDLALASGDVFFVHVPGGTEPNRIVPGGYVIVADTAQIPLTGGPDSPQEFTLPCTVVAQPPPEVIGGTMTYGALLDLYGGYNNVLAANPTYAALLDLMASRDALVVI